jgi:UDP:flavonoid glycosyltransferase YjiC (YdhE family)
LFSPRAAWAACCARIVAEPLQLRAEYGLPPDPDLAMLEAQLALAPFPEFREFPLPTSAFPFRQSEVALAGEPLERLTVYFTLGTVFNTESGDLFSRVLTGLRELPANIVVTVGKHIDPAEFGPQLPHIRIERFIPQASLLPSCDLVVSHGGSGGVLGARARPAVRPHADGRRPTPQRTAVRRTRCGAGTGSVHTDRSGNV